MTFRLHHVMVLFLLGGIVLLAEDAHGTPLTLRYDLTDRGDGTFRYDFNLVLDNHDGSWDGDEQWDWFILGDAPAPGEPASIPIDRWTQYPAAFNQLTFPGGGDHNGIGVYLEANIGIPGWKPTKKGESLSWSGIAEVSRPQGELYWSALTTGGGAQKVEYELAQPQNVIPEPSTLGLVALGIMGTVALATLRHRRKWR